MSEQEGLPVRDTPAEVLGTMHFVLVALGKELGERYNKVFQEEVGPNWVQALSNIRKKSINPNDAQFVLSEPLRNPSSPARKCLPSGGAFYNQLEDALQVRNDWMHHDIEPLNFQNLYNSVNVIDQLASTAGMRLGTLCSQIKKRIKDILSGKYVANENALNDHSEELAALQAELRQAQIREEALVQEVDVAHALLEEAAQIPATSTIPSGDSSNLEVELSAAEEKLARLEFLVESLIAAQQEKPEDIAKSDLVTQVSLLPGHRWVGSLPTRSTTLMGLQDDLFDPLLRAGVAVEFGDGASTRISEWRQLVAPGATILITPEGHSVSYIDGEPTFLGSLKSSSTREPESSQLSGFFTGNTYTLRINGTIEHRESGDSLVQLNPDQGKQVGEKLKTLMPKGGRLRVTTNGTVARYLDGNWKAVAQVSPDEWFPGHLQFVNGYA
jgi:hypothetical protein